MTWSETKNADMTSSKTKNADMTLSDRHNVEMTSSEAENVLMVRMERLECRHDPRQQQQQTYIWMSTWPKNKKQTPNVGDDDDDDI